jgi:ketosteroid isomerase-like protein
MPRSGRRRYPLPVTEQQVRDLLDAFGQAWNDHDLDAALSMCTDDVVFESTGPAPDGERAEGQNAVRTAWQPGNRSSTIHFDGEELVLLGDRAVQTWSYRWADGHVRGVDIFKVRDGKVAEKFSYVKG